MTKRLLVVCTVALALILSVGMALAANVEAITAKLPHETVVGAVTIPAGDYTIRNINNGDTPVLLFHSNSGFNATVLATRILSGPETPEKTQLILEREGDTYRLTKIWIPDLSFGYEFIR